MKKVICISVFTLLLSVFFLPKQSVSAAPIGYKAFKLGITKTKAKMLLNSTYKNYQKSFLNNNRIFFTVSNKITVMLFFDQNQILYSIGVKIIYGS